MNLIHKEHFGKELIQSILCHLTTEELLKKRTVCKYWNSTIGSSSTCTIVSIVIQTAKQIFLDKLSNKKLLAQSIEREFFGIEANYIDNNTYKTYESGKFKIYLMKNLVSSPAFFPFSLQNYNFTQQKKKSHFFDFKKLCLSKKKDREKAFEIYKNQELTEIIVFHKIDKENNKLIIKSVSFSPLDNETNKIYVKKETAEKVTNFFSSTRVIIQ